MNPWVSIAAAVIPEIGSIITAISNLRKKYPALTAAQIQAMVADITGQADTAFDDVLAKIAADQKPAGTP